MKNRRFLVLCSFLSNVLIFVMVFYAVGTSWREYAATNANGMGFKTFRYFTTDSIVLCGIASLLAAGFTLPVLLKKRERVPKGVLLFKYTGACAVALTFAVVLAFLGPIHGYGSMFIGTSFYLHGIVPILAMVSWIAFDRGCRLKVRAFLLGLIFAAAYGAVYFIQVVVRGFSNGGWMDFYMLRRGCRWWLSFPLVGLGAAVLCILLLVLHNRCDRE